MKQPKVKLFDQIYSVKNIEFNRDGGIDCIWYYWHREDDGVNLIVEGETDKPVTHPHEDYVVVPNFESVLITEQDRR